MFLKVIGKGSFGKVSKASELLVGYLQMPVMPVIVTGSQSLSQPASQLDGRQISQTVVHSIVGQSISQPDSTFLSSVSHQVSD